ncbi:uncharacterized protein LOC121867769 [Homarus americanus]|uniref:uncharacterized protein LOC121867769 n=1 Tax=Homarus americanus TaxID=6706 RepID=UPI001C487938|nr:uncharacterized protein LOC121867769 [Homarus americanus]
MTTAETIAGFPVWAENSLGVAVKTKLVLNVLHSPVWVVRPPEQLDVYEGAELVVTASADANPGPLRYWWRRGEETLEATAGELRLGRISRKSTGNYTVNGYNPRGAVNASFHLNVQYGPENVQSAERVTVGERGAATVECSAHANPTPTLTWTRDSHNSTTQTISSGVGVARLVLESASWTDTGVYLCHASNLVSSAPPVVTSIIVTQAPTVAAEVAGAGGTWAAVGGDGRLVCRVRAAPAPTFSWATQDGVEILDSEKYYMLEPQLVDGLVLWAGVLEVRKVERNDYTTYVCSATNALGSDTAHLTLNPPARPHPPSNFTVTNVTEATVSLSWTPNFQAGLPRGYTLRYRPAGTLEYQLIDISGGNTAGTTLGGLRAGVDYFFSIQASNDQGRSHYLTPPLLVTLLAGASGSSSSSSSRWRIPRLILVIMTLTGAALLVLNVVIIACFVRRRSLARHTSGSSSHKTVALETYCNTPVSTPGHHHHPEVLLSLNTATNNTRTSNTVASYKEDQLTSVERRGRSDSGVSNREGRPGVTRLQNGGVSRKNSNGSSSQNGGVIVRNASGNLNVENDNGGGTLRQNGGVPSVTSPAACVNGGGGSSPTTTPLNARMVPAPQGHVHPPTNPEVCSLTSSTYDTHASVSHHKRRDSGSLPADDQVSLSSYQSTHSRTYSQGYVRPLPPPGCPHHPATRSQPLYPGAVGRPYPQQEQQTKQQQQKQQQQQPAGPPTYSSLNPSSLYSLSSEYYDARCSQSSFSPGAPMGYSTLGPRSRRSNPSQFATLQRPRASRTPVPYNPQSTGHQCATPAPQRQGGDCCQQCHLKSSEDDYHSITVCQGHQDMADPHHLHQHLRRSSFHGPLRRDTQRHDVVCPASQHGAVSAGYGTTQHQNSISPQYSTVQHPDGDNTPHSSLAQEYNTTQGSSPPNNNRGQQLHPHRCHAHSTTCTSQTNLSTPQDAPLQDLSPACASPSRQRTASLRSSSFRSGGSQEDPTCSSTNSTRQKNVPLRTSSSFKSNALPQDSSPSCDSPTRQRQATLRASSSFKSDVPRKDPVAAAAGRPRFPHDYVRQGSGKTRSSSTSKTTTNDAAADKVKLTSTFSDPS